MEEFQLLIDVWEGQLEIDEATLKANGVAGISVRLNDTLGGHHMDENFEAQWAQAAPFVRFPYFVYNPWVDGQTNFDWLATHCPPEATAVMADIEVYYPGYPEGAYAREAQAFVNLCKARWSRVVIYTGEWFLPMLSAWPTNVEYVWAQYPYALYPDDVTEMTWDEVREIISGFDGPANADKVPSRWGMWQCSGDRLILPGTIRPVDVIVFPGSLEALEAYIGSGGSGEPTTPEGAQYTGFVVEASGVKLRSGPGTSYGRLGVLLRDEQIFASEIRQITPGTEEWLHIVEAGGEAVDGWSASVYGGRELIRWSRLPGDGDPPVEPPVEPTPDKVVASIALTMPDGSTRKGTAILE